MNKVFLNIHGKIHEVKLGLLTPDTSGYLHKFFPSHDGGITDDQVYLNPEGQTLYNVTLSELFDTTTGAKNYVLINQGIIGSKDTAKPALLIDDGIPQGAMVQILNIGYIVGMGGTSNSYGMVAPINRYRVGSGGDAIRILREFVFIQNLATIGGGGGAGSAIRAWRTMSNRPTTVTTLNGGGGAGELVGNTGATAPTIDSGGAGQYAYIFNSHVYGGNGGGLGQDGGAGYILGGLNADVTMAGFAGYAISYPNIAFAPDYLGQDGQLLGINGVK